MKLFSEFTLGNIELKNRAVMAPLTRSRATNNIPNELMVTYYRQRAGAGLIISEGTAPSANGLGYPRIPGLYSKAQVQAWKKVTEAVHQKGGKIFTQLMHTGRVSHPDNMEPGAKIVAPSAIATSGEMYTDAKGLQAYPVPKKMTVEDIIQAQNEYVQAAKNAITAGFDGVELHGANGYLIDQFINTASNKRTDNYGGSKENRCRFAVEVAQKVADAIGKEKTGIRLSPYGASNGMVAFEGIDDTFEYLAGALGKLGLVYVHLVDHSATGAPAVPAAIKSKIKKAFGRTIITCGDFDKEKAETALQEGRGELVAFGRPFIANSDLVYRMKNDIALNDPDYATFYTPGEKGYTDYPVAKETGVAS